MGPSAAPSTKTDKLDEEKGPVVKGTPQISVIPTLISYIHPLPDHRDSDDPSSMMWALCISKTDKHDTAMAERWKADMDGILLYVRIEMVGFSSLTHLAQNDL
jgi:hypothetical protein